MVSYPVPDYILLRGTDENFAPTSNWFMFYEEPYNRERNWK
jgi:hypothetical protein